MVGMTLDRPGRPGHGVRVYWERLSERSLTPTSGRASTASQGRLGTLRWSGPCSMPSLSRRLIEAVATKLLVPVVAAIPKPGGGNLG